MGNQDYLRRQYEMNALRAEVMRERVRDLEQQYQAAFGAGQISERALGNQEFSGQAILAQGQAAAFRAVPPPKEIIKEVVKEVPPSYESMSKALWYSDPRVQKFCGEKSECRYEVPDPGAHRWGRAEEVAWARDEGGWRTEAQARARAVLVHFGVIVPADSGGNAQGGSNG